MQASRLVVLNLDPVDGSCFMSGYRRTWLSHVTIRTVPGYDRGKFGSTVTGAVQVGRSALLR
jgi:hypothetical protein